MKEEHIAQAVIEEQPDVIAISFLSTTSYPTTKSMAARLKGVAPETPIIVGGVFATMNSTNILGDCPHIDCVGVGEGEELLPDYLEHLDDLGSVAGLVWRSKERVVVNLPRPLVQNLDQFPFPDRSSLPIDYIESMPLDVPAVLSLDRFCTMQTSRGCPYPCIYCDIPALSDGKWRCRSPEHVLEEMQRLSDEGYRSIYFTDDHFLLKRKRITEICEGIIERELKFRWGCEGRVDSVAVDQFPIMGKANCRWLAFFLIGSPEETEEDILESFRFAARLQLDTFGFNRLCVYRGTPLWAEYVQRGIIDDELDWDKWFKCSDIDPTVLPSEVVNQARKKGYMRLFLRRIFFRPIATFLLLRTFSRHMKKSDIAKMLWSPFRKQTLFRKPELPARMIEQGLDAPIRDSATNS
jgi:radical SAM superfamily enzyme YgiQ (UPF0313 family)